MVVAWLASSAAITEPQMTITASVAGIKPSMGRSWMAPKGAMPAVAMSTTAITAPVTRRCCAVGCRVANGTSGRVPYRPRGHIRAPQHMPRTERLQV